MRASSPTTFLFSLTSLNRGRRDLRCTTMMDRHREKTSTLLTRLAYGLSRKLSRPTVGRSPTTQAGPSETTGRSPETQTSPSATVDRSPATQTSPSATSRVGSLRRMLIYFILFLQFSNFQMNSSFPFSHTSPPTRTPTVTMPGSTCRTVRGCVTTTMSGRGFYGR